MEDKKFTWREFLKLLLSGLTPTNEEVRPEIATALQLLEGDNSGSKDPWADVKKALKQVKGYYLEGIGSLRGAVQDKTSLDDDLSQQKAETRLFFLIEYRQGEPIMQAGTFSDYVALYKQGTVHLVLDPPATGKEREKSCWSAPTVPRTWLRRAVNRLFSRNPHHRILPTTPTEQAAAIPLVKMVPGEPLPPLTDLPSRLHGFTSVFWKQPRNATLLAADDGDNNRCQMVLVQRILLRDCLLFTDVRQTEVTQLYKTKVVDFFKQSLPASLALNRLFRPLFYVEEIEHWEKLLEGLAPKNNKGSRRRNGGW